MSFLGFGSKGKGKSLGEVVRHLRESIAQLERSNDKTAPKVFSNNSFCKVTIN